MQPGRITVSALRLDQAKVASQVMVQADSVFEVIEPIFGAIRTEGRLLPTRL